jgi:hypothetical protein
MIQLVIQQISFLTNVTKHIKRSHSFGWLKLTDEVKKQPQRFWKSHFPQSVPNLYPLTLLLIWMSAQSIEGQNILNLLYLMRSLRLS